MGVRAEGTQPATSDLPGTRDCHLSSYIAHFSEAFPTASLGRPPEIVVLTVNVRQLVFALTLLNPQPARATATTLRLTDSQGTDVVVEGVTIDYGGLLSVDKETQGIRVQQGDGSVLLKWSDLDTLRVTKRDDAVKPPRIELEIVLRNQKRASATLTRAGKMQLAGRTELGEYTIDLEKIRRLVPVR